MDEFGAFIASRLIEAVRDAQKNAAQKASAPAPKPPAPGRRLPTFDPQARAVVPAAPSPATFDMPVAPTDVGPLDFGGDPSPAAAAGAPRASVELLSAFATRGALLSAIVLQEALAPPLALRPRGAHREDL